MAVRETSRAWPQSTRRRQAKLDCHSDRRCSRSGWLAGRTDSIRVARAAVRQPAGCDPYDHGAGKLHAHAPRPRLDACRLAVPRQRRIGRSIRAAGPHGRLPRIVDKPTASHRYFAASDRHRLWRRSSDFGGLPCAAGGPGLRARSRVATLLVASFCADRGRIDRCLCCRSHYLRPRPPVPDRAAHRGEPAGIPRVHRHRCRRGVDRYDVHAGDRLCEQGRREIELAWSSQDHGCGDRPGTGRAAGPRSAGYRPGGIAPCDDRRPVRRSRPVPDSRCEAADDRDVPGLRFCRRRIFTRAADWNAVRCADRYGRWLVTGRRSFAHRRVCGLRARCRDKPGYRCAIDDRADRLRADAEF